MADKDRTIRPRWSRSASGFVSIGVAVALAATSLVAMLASGHPRSVVSVFDGAAWVLSRKKGNTAQHLNLASGSPDRSRSVGRGTLRLATVGNMGIGYDPETGQVDLSSVDDAHLLGSQTIGRDPARVRTVAGDGMAWLVDGANGVAQALVADDSLSVTFSTPVSVQDAEGELAPDAASTPAGVDASGRLWVGVRATGQIVPLEADKAIAPGRQPAARRLAAVRVAPPGTPVAVSIIDGQAHALVGDVAGGRFRQSVAPGTTLGRATPLPPGARLAEQTSTTVGADGTARVSVVAPADGGAQIVRIQPGGDHPPQIVDLPAHVDAAQVAPPVSTRGATILADPERGKVYVVRTDGAIEVRDLGRRGQPVDLQVVHGNVIINDPDTNRVVTVDPQGRSREDRKYPDGADPKVDAPAPPKVNKTPLPKPVPTPSSIKPGAVGQGTGTVKSGTGPTTTLTGAPGAPTALQSVPGKASAQLLWSPPGSGSPVASYQITCAAGCPSPVTALTVGASATTTTVSGLLVDGPSYTFQIRAVDAKQRPGPTANFPSVQPASEVPGAPRCTPFADGDIGDTDLTARWTSGPLNGSRVDGYTVQAIDPAGARPPVAVTTAGNANFTVLPGLVNGVAYEVTVRATAGGAASPACAAVTATPFGKPGAATGVRVDSLDGGLQVSWQEPDDGGSPIIDATITGGRAPKTELAGVRASTLPGLQNGQSYMVVVTLRNKRGSSSAAPVSRVPAGSIGISNFTVVALPDRAIRSSFAVNWNGHVAGSCTMVLEGDRTAGGDCGGFDVGGLQYSKDYTVHIEVQAPDGAKTSSAPAPIRTNDPPTVTDTISWAVGLPPKFYNNPSFSSPNGAPTQNSTWQFTCNRQGDSYNYFNNGKVAGTTTWWAQISDGRWVPEVYLLGNQNGNSYAQDDPRIPNC